jgi:hypothetical protein
MTARTPRACTVPYRPPWPQRGVHDDHRSRTGILRRRGDAGATPDEFRRGRGGAVTVQDERGGRITERDRRVARARALSERVHAFNDGENTARVYRAVQVQSCATSSPATSA